MKYFSTINKQAYIKCIIIGLIIDKNYLKPNKVEVFLKTSGIQKLFSKNSYIYILGLQS